MSKQTTGQFLSLLRKAAGYTQEDVSDKLNISNKTISSWETDRTMPDVLLLPAIADLYGVTVDEILRGERNQPDKFVNAELTEKSRKCITRNKYGKFSAKCNLLCCISFLCGLLVFGGSLLGINIISLILFILGYSGVFICITIAVFFANSIKVSEGAVFKEDLTAELKAIILPLCKKIKNLIFISAIPFGAGTAFYVVLGITDGTVEQTDGIVEQIFITGIPFVILLVLGLIWYIVSKMKYGNKKSF